MAFGLKSIWSGLKSIAAPLINVAGNIIGGNSARKAQREANATNIQLQQEQLAWQEKMANTEWQRGKADMIAAGFNPMLAFSQGGASSPNVSAATVIPEDAMGRSISSAADKAATSLATGLTLERMRIENDIAKQKRLQEEFATDKLKQERTAENDMVQIGIDTARAGRDTAVTNARIREIERKVAEATMDFNVSSARDRARILEKEVDIAQARKILTELDIPEKEAIAKWFSQVGALSPAAKAVMSLGQWLKFIFNK